MEQTSVNLAWRTMITDLLALPENYVRPANQNAPAEGIEAKFITVLITDVTGSGVQETREDIRGTNDMLYHLCAMRQATAQLQAYGPGAFDLMLKLNALLYGSWSAWNFQQATLGMIAVRGPVDTDAIIPAKLWQRRAVMNVDFYFVIKVDLVVPCFASFSWDIYLDEDGSAHFEWKVGEPWPKCPIGGIKSPFLKSPALHHRA